MYHPKYTSSGITARPRVIYFDQLALTSQIIVTKSSKRQYNVLCNTKYHQSLKNFPKTCMAKSMPYKDQLTASSKQYRCE